MSIILKNYGIFKYSQRELTKRVIQHFNTAVLFSNIQVIFLTTNLSFIDAVHPTVYRLHIS